LDTENEYVLPKPHQGENRRIWRGGQDSKWNRGPYVARGRKKTARREKRKMTMRVETRATEDHEIRYKRGKGKKQK